MKNQLTETVDKQVLSNKTIDLIHSLSDDFKLPPVEIAKLITMFLERYSRGHYTLSEIKKLVDLIPINESFSSDIYKSLQNDIDKLLGSIIQMNKGIHNKRDAAMALSDVLKYFYD